MRLLESWQAYLGARSMLDKGRAFEKFHDLVRRNLLKLVLAISLFFREGIIGVERPLKVAFDNNPCSLFPSATESSDLGPDLVGCSSVHYRCPD